MEITFLGTGTSHGVPAIDCMINDYRKCPQGVCKESMIDPKHSRTRCSILIKTADHSILVDASLDFRAQMLKNNVKHIDAALFTHSHSDHIGGLADIRSYTKGENALPVYGSESTIIALKNRFDYIFNPPKILGGGIPRLEAHIVKHKSTFNLFGIDITPVEVMHGSLTGCFGYRIGSVAYIPDLKCISEESKEVLKGVDVLILNALRRNPQHETHLTLEESVKLAEELMPSKCYFTHMSHDIHYVNDQKNLPGNMTFAYDGLIINT